MGSATKYQRTLFEPEHELFRESYRAFLDRHVAPYHDEWEKTKIVDRGVWLEAGKQGFLGMAVTCANTQSPGPISIRGYRRFTVARPRS